MRSSAEQDSVVPLLVGATKEAAERKGGYAYAVVSRSKGRGDREAIVGLVRYLLDAGIAGTVRLRSDPEPSIQAVSQEVAALRSPATTIVEITPKGSSSSLGTGERMIQAIAGQVRALKIVVEQKWGQPVLTSSPVFP
eukprot:9327448-Heterocapsa_arctica.AAC.1